MDITKKSAVARAHALASFAHNIAHHIGADDIGALGLALTGLERTVADLRDYQANLSPPLRFNMFAIDEDADERGSEG
jgi:hypothetical protein